MEEAMQILCDVNGVDFDLLITEVRMGAESQSGRIFYPAECKVLLAALEVAGGV